MELHQGITMSFHWTQTNAVLVRFFKLFACEKCKKVPEKPIKLVMCGHVFCDTCCTADTSVCIKCSMQIGPNEMQLYRLAAQLISYCQNIKEAIEEIDLDDKQIDKITGETNLDDENVARRIASMMNRAKEKDSQSDTPGYRDPTQYCLNPEGNEVDWDSPGQTSGQQNSAQSLPQLSKGNEAESETPGYRDPTQMNESLKGNEAESETPGYRDPTQISQEKQGNLKNKISKKLIGQQKRSEDRKADAMDVEEESRPVNSDIYVPETAEIQGISYRKVDGANRVIPESMETAEDDHDTVSVGNLAQDWTQATEIAKEARKNGKPFRSKDSETKLGKSSKLQTKAATSAELVHISEELNSQGINEIVRGNSEEKQDKFALEIKRAKEVETPVARENLATVAATDPEIIATETSGKADNSLAVKKPQLRSGTSLNRRNVTKRRPTASDAHLKTIPKNVNKRNPKGESLLHTACVKGQDTYVKALLAAGANPNTKDNANWTPLQETVTHGYREICKMLLESGASPNTPGMENRTALHDAAICDRIYEATLLLQFNANTDVYDKFGKRPIDYAVSHEMHTLLRDSNVEKLAVDENRCLNTTLDHSMITPNAKIIVLPSNLCSGNKKLLTKMATKHKITVVTAFRPGVTHVIVEANERNTADLTYDVMLAILEGKWILNSQWIAIATESNDISEIDFEIFQVQGAPNCGTPERSRINEEKQNPRLFNNCFFYFTIGAKASWNYGKLEFTKQNLTNLVLAGEGEVLHREPDPEHTKDSVEKLRPFHVAHKPMHPLHRCSHYIIYMPGKDEPRVKYNMPHIKSLPLAWFFECIEKFALVDPILMGIS